MSRLSVMLTEANVDGLSYRHLEERSEALGSRLSRDTWWKLLSGRHGVPDEQTLEAVHAVFPSLSLVALRRAAALPAEENGPWTPPPESARLTKRQREALDEMVRLLTVPSSSNEERDVDAQPAEEKTDQLAQRRARKPAAKKAPRRRAAYTGNGDPEAEHDPDRHNP